MPWWAEMLLGAGWQAGKNRYSTAVMCRRFKIVLTMIACVGVVCSGHPPYAHAVLAFDALVKQTAVLFGQSKTTAGMPTASS